jgi:hypothetical protein
MKKPFDEEMINADAALEREKEEMKKIDEKIDEKTQKLAEVIGIQQSGHKLSLSGVEKGSKFVMVKKQSSRVTDKGAKVIDKAQARKAKTDDLDKSSNPFFVFNNYQPAHFVSVAQSCGIEMGNVKTSALKIISTMEAQEKAQAMLNETRIRRERELQLEKEKNNQLVVIEGDIAKDVREGENEESVDTSSEGSIENAPKLKRVTMRKRRQGVVGNTKTS